MSRGVLLPLAALLALSLAGCFQASTPGDGGLAQARDAARSAAQADDAAKIAADPQAAALASQHGNITNLDALPRLRVGQTWTGAITTPTSRVALLWRVAGVNEPINLGGQDVLTYRLAVSAGKMSGTQLLRQSDLALIKTAWNQTQDAAQPYPSGLVTVSNEPCALQWPAAAGSTWTTTCTLRSWMEQSPTQVASAAQTVSWSVTKGNDGTLKMTGQGTITPDGQPDSPQHFTQILTLSGNCDPSQWQRIDSQGGSEAVASKTC